MLGSLLSQLLYAMSTGFINLARSDPQNAAAQPFLSRNAASHSALAARKAAALKNFPDASADAEEAEVAGGGSSMAPIVTCSATLEVSRSLFLPFLLWEGPCTNLQLAVGHPERMLQLVGQCTADSASMLCAYLQGDPGEEEDRAAEEDSGAEWRGSGQHEPTAVAADQRQPVQWQPGTVANIREGGSDVQAVLDSPGVGLCIVNWHALWVEACLEIVPFMQRCQLVQRHLNPYC